MEILEEIEEKLIIIALKGELTAANSVYLEDFFENLHSKNYEKILVDCLKLTYTSSAGIGVFLSHMDRILNRNGIFGIFNLNGKPKEVVELLGLSERLNVKEKKSDFIK